MLRAGRIPRHVALIMDGNRRFARRQHLETVQGHARGFDKLKETLEWCLDLGVEVVTVYAFSIENFKRPTEEVETLMRLATEKFAQLLEKNDLIQKHGICVRVLGDITLLPLDVRLAIARVVSISRHNTRAVLNVCFAYTSRAEMAHAVDLMAAGVDASMIRESDIDEELMERCLYTEEHPPPELVVRTSGETRLSDFLLWQVLWPDFTFWHLCICILHYQRHAGTLDQARVDHVAHRRSRITEEDKICASKEAKQTHVDAASVLSYRERREERVALFLQHVRHLRQDYIDKLLATTWHDFYR